MGLLTTLITGVSGLIGNSRALNVIGDNIANVNTSGFKSSRPIFGDVLSATVNQGASAFQVGQGSHVTGVLQSLTQGAFEQTNNALDLAVDGAGFFVVSNGTGNLFTRAGQFQVNGDGFVQNITGQTLQGFEISSSGAVSSKLTDINLTGVQSKPQATTNFTLGVNLDSTASTGTEFISTVPVFNSVGDEVDLSITFTKVAGSNTWDFEITAPGADVTSGGMGTLKFGIDGQLIEIDGDSSFTDPEIVIDYDASDPPAEEQTLTWMVANSPGVSNEFVTGFATESTNTFLVQDGFTAGSLLGLSVNNEGIIIGEFDNGESQNLFKLALANFLAPTGLDRRGDNLFAQTASSGSPIIGTATSGSFGSILGQTLELSNVELATEFVALIKTQQAFRANARVITITDELLSETVDLTRQL